MHYKEYIQATGINVLYLFAVYLFMPILAPYVKSLGLDAFQIGLIFSLSPLFTIFSSSIMGKLSDEIGRMWVIIIGMILQITAIIFYLIGNHWIFIAGARLFGAVAFVAVTLVAIAKIEDSLTNKERGKYAGWSFSIGHIGAIVAPIIGGLLVDKLFIKAPFILSAVILLALSFMLVYRTPKLKVKPSKKSFNLYAGIKNFLAERPLKAMAILGMVMHATTPAIQVFMPLLIIEKLGLTYSSIGLAMFFLGVTNLFQFFFGQLSDKFNRGTLILVGCGIYAFFMFFVSTTNTYWVLLILLLFQGVGGAIWNVSAWSLMSDIGEKTKKEGEIVGSYMSIAKIGSFISFIFSGLIVSIWGISSIFAVNAIIIAIGIIIASFYLDHKIYAHPQKIS